MTSGAPETMAGVEDDFDFKKDSDKVAEVCSGNRHGG